MSSYVDDDYYRRREEARRDDYRMEMARDEQRQAEYRRQDALDRIRKDEENRLDDNRADDERYDDIYESRKKREASERAHKAIRDGDTFEALRNLIGPDAALGSVQSD